ncbi:MAG: VOC family protein [Chloroflexi bacterium]|nr:VOC family protein [Chloroflexota bacterium]
MPAATRITPFLWFAHEAEEAAALYTSIFPNSRITNVARYGETGEEVTGGTPGSVMTVSFELDGQPFVALNGRAGFDFTEAVSFQVACASQAELDHFWDRLSAGADPAAQQCGWLKDRFGVSWQVVPTRLFELLADPDPGKAERTTTAMLAMKKLDIAELERAHAG